METLTDFADRWLSSTVLRPPVYAYERAGQNIGVTLYRDDRFQVQIWTLPPDSVVPEHAHPATDTWLIRVAGKMRFKLNGRWVSLHEMQRTRWLGLATWRHRVPPGAPHEVTIGHPGGSFLAISERVDGLPPASVQKDWAGPALDDVHGLGLGDAPWE